MLKQVRGKIAGPLSNHFSCGDGSSRGVSRTPVSPLVRRRKDHCGGTVLRRISEKPLEIFHLGRLRPA